MTCPNCHATVPPGSVFCHNCGTRAEPPATEAPARPGAASHTYSGLSTVAPMREARSSTIDPGAVFANRYEVLRKIGEGGMGVV
ncbi:MAG: zinc-ribbon domain-containing protein, partial [Acidobacteria bacterium]|nr:zinc-ribbon domain-containing protein [Acidobacteriota bacterium]